MYLGFFFYAVNKYLQLLKIRKIILSKIFAGRKLRLMVTMPNHEVSLLICTAVGRCSWHFTERSLSLCVLGPDGHGSLYFLGCVLFRGFTPLLQFLERHGQPGEST